MSTIMTIVKTNLMISMTRLRVNQRKIMLESLVIDPLDILYFTGIQRIFSVETHYNPSYQKSYSKAPYEGYQDPNKIDWSAYGPDRPGKVEKLL